METTNVSTVPEGYEIYKQNDTDNFILFQDINFALGFAGSLVNIQLLLIMFTSFTYLSENKLISCLAIGDCLNCLGVMLQGLQRGNIYRKAFTQNIIPIQTYWSCAWMAFDLIQLLGALLPAITTFCMGCERYLASNYLHIYRKKFNIWGTLFTTTCIAYTFVAVLIAFILSFLNRDQKANYWCGRKVSYTHNYMRFCYLMNVFCYFSCFLSTTFCLIKVRRMLKSNNGNQENKDNLLRIKNLFVIVVISTITVALPSLISFATSFRGIADVAIADASDWMLVFKSSMNLFVYFNLNMEFRKRVISIFKKIQVLLATKNTTPIIATKISVTQKSSVTKSKTITLK
uniref:G_PROTEIN_RECEP_F1_2 domain-containing protein n=1 Tax=Rhabditophanes sp. KR3021 TaxID=114890 RepID=A0AC35TJS6_9BILA